MFFQIYFIHFSKSDFKRLLFSLFMGSLFKKKQRFYLLISRNNISLQHERYKKRNNTYR